MPRIFQRTHEALKRYATNRDLKARWIFFIVPMESGRKEFLCKNKAQFGGGCTRIYF